MGYRLGIRPFGTEGMTAKVARGGARADKPRGVRVLAITVESTMAAMTLKVPPLLKGSVPCRYRTPGCRRAQLMGASADGGGASPCSAEVSWVLTGALGMISGGSLALGASTLWKRRRGSRGRGGARPAVA
jgi:hypothetical protein